MSYDYRESESYKALVERERKERARLERGGVPRTNQQSALAFVQGYEPRTLCAPSRTSLHLHHTDPTVLLSYATPVAFRDPDSSDIYTSEESYTPSTSKHLSAIRSEMIAAGYKMVSRDAVRTPDGIRGMGRISPVTAFQQWSTDPEKYGVWRSALWTSPNGKWSIHPNGHQTGYDAIPFVILGWERWTAAHVFARSLWGDGPYIRTTGSHDIPQYVEREVSRLWEDGGGDQ